MLTRVTSTCSCAILLILAACFWSGQEAPSEPTTVESEVLTASQTPASTPTPSQAPEVLPPVLLEADPSAPARGWSEVLFVPFGPNRDELGFVPANESIPLSPSSFAIDCGSAPLVWIADNAKDRIVEYVGLPGGELYESIRVREGSRIRDLALRSCGDLWAIVDETKGAIASIGRLGVGRRLLLTGGSDRLSALTLFGTPGSLEVSTPGGLSSRRPGFSGIGRINIDTGVVTPEPGLFVPSVSARDPVWIGVDSADGRTWTVTWSNVDSAMATGDFVINLVNGEGELIPAIANVFPETRTWEGIVARVEVSSDLGGDGGEWYLEIPADPHGRIVFHPLPEGSVEAEQARHLAFDGYLRLYVMVTDRNGIRILAR